MHLAKKAPSRTDGAKHTIAGGTAFRAPKSPGNAHRHNLGAELSSAIAPPASTLKHRQPSSGTKNSCSVRAYSEMRHLQKALPLNHSSGAHDRRDVASDCTRLANRIVSRAPYARRSENLAHDVLPRQAVQDGVQTDCGVQRIHGLTTHTDHLDIRDDRIRIGQHQHTRPKFHPLPGQTCMYTVYGTHPDRAAHTRFRAPAFLPQLRAHVQERRPFVFRRRREPIDNWPRFDHPRLKTHMSTPLAVSVWMVTMHQGFRNLQTLMMYKALQ